MNFAESASAGEGAAAPCPYCVRASRPLTSRSSRATAEMRAGRAPEDPARERAPVGRPTW